MTLNKLSKIYLAIVGILCITSFLGYVLFAVLYVGIVALTSAKNLLEEVVVIFIGLTLAAMITYLFTEGKEKSKKKIK